jgi:hypothetical protein
MKNWLLAIIGTSILSGCASVNGPKITYRTNIPLFYSSSITVRNSAGPDVVIVPQSRGDGFVAEYQLGKRTFRTLWLVREKIPTKLVELKHGETFTIPLGRNTTDRTVSIPFAVKVIERGKVIGSFSYCLSAYPYQDNVAELNFGPRALRALKQGDTGYQCGNRGYYW